MPLTLKEEGDILEEKERLLNDTQVFWSNLTQLKMSEFNYLHEKLKENFSDETFARLEIVTNELKHLDLKRNFELKEYHKLQAEQEIFDKKFVKKQKEDFKLALSSKLSEKFNNRKKSRVDKH